MAQKISEGMFIKPPNPLKGEFFKTFIVGAMPENKAAVNLISCFQSRNRPPIRGLGG